MNSRTALYLGAEVLAEVAARGEPGDRIGPPQNHGVLLGAVKEVGDPLVFHLDVVASVLLLFACLVIGCRVGDDRQRVGVWAIGRLLSRTRS